MRRLPFPVAVFCACLLGLPPLRARATNRQAFRRGHKSARAGAAHQAEKPAKTHGAVVSYVTVSGAYLGLGTDAGLQVGMSLPIARRGRPVGSCELTVAGPHEAFCTTKGHLRAGDVFTAPVKGKPEAAAEKAKPLPPLTTASTRSAQRVALEASSFKLVDFHASGKTLENLRAEIRLEESLFAVQSSPGSTYDTQTLNLSLRGAELGAGFRAYLDVTVVNYAQRPLVYTFPETATTQVFVRQAAVAFRSPSTPWTFAAGRFWPSVAQGVGVLDGAEAGWHNTSNTLDWGLFGGTVPNPTTTLPTIDHPLLGAYVSTTQAFGRSWFQGSSYAAVQDLPGAGWHEALDVLGLLSFDKWLDTSAELRVGTGVFSAPDAVELANFDLDARLGHLHLSANFRYMYDSLTELLQPGMTSPTDSSLYAYAVLSYDFTIFSARLTGTFVRDFVTFENRGFFGPELALPKILGSTGDLSFGYQEELGWLDGRDAYVQATLHPARAFELAVRTSYSYTVGAGYGLAVGEQAVSALAQAKLRANRWLTLVASLYGELAVYPGSDALPLPLGLSGTFAANARF